jgi:hypothetical protein
MKVVVLLNPKQQVRIFCSTGGRGQGLRVSLQFVQYQKLALRGSKQQPDNYNKSSNSTSVCADTPIHLPLQNLFVVMRVLFRSYY